MEDVGVVPKKVAGAVAVVGIGIQDGKPLHAVSLPQVDDA
jgi:hypothetical protein